MTSLTCDNDKELASIAKEECMDYLQTLHLYCNTEDREMMNVCVDKLILLINEHFDNPPLKWEELKEGMWVWDNICKEYVRCYPNTSCCGEKCVCYWGEHRDGDFVYLDNLIFEENRFYRKQVE